MRIARRWARHLEQRSEPLSLGPYRQSLGLMRTELAAMRPRRELPLPTRPPPRLRYCCRLQGSLQRRPGSRQTGCRPGSRQTDPLVTGAIMTGATGLAPDALPVAVTTAYDSAGGEAWAPDPPRGGPVMLLATVPLATPTWLAPDGAALVGPTWLAPDRTTREAALVGPTWLAPDGTEPEAPPATLADPPRGGRS